MKIKAVTDEYIEFTNGNRITYSHLHDCCYSIQNGYYSTDLEIRYSGDCVFRTICEERFG